MPKLRRRARVNVLLLFLATTVVLGFAAIFFLLHGGSQFLGTVAVIVTRTVTAVPPTALAASLLP